MGNASRTEKTSYGSNPSRLTSHKAEETSLAVGNDPPQLIAKKNSNSSVYASAHESGASEVLEGAAPSSENDEDNNADSSDDIKKDENNNDNDENANETKSDLYNELMANTASSRRPAPLRSIKRRAKLRANNENTNSRPGRDDIDYNEHRRSADSARATGRVSRWHHTIVSLVGNCLHECFTLGGRIRPCSSSSSAATLYAEHALQNIPSDQYHIPPPDEGTSLLHGIRYFFQASIVDLTIWLFKTSFINVMTFFLSFFFVLIFLCALVLHGVEAGASDYECVTGFDPVENDFGDNFEIAFSLSWTAFTSVGFGAVSPHTEPGCYPIRVTTAIVAFVGMIYGSSCAAIFYSKLLRLLAKAHVTFSSTLCIQYGSGVEEPTHGLITGPLSRLLGTSKEHLPYPVLGFRIVNDRANQKHTEIWDAKVSCMVSVNLSPSEEKKKKDDANNDNDDDTESESDSEKELVDDIDSGANEARTIQLQKRAFQRVKLQTSHHPYFRRVWYARHILDASSPLLKRHVREDIEKRGNWNPDIDDYDSVRQCLVEFNHINVTFTGKSAISADDVFAEKKYGFQDVCVGWQFAGIFYKEKPPNGKKEKLWVDMSLIHDILPQKGGGNEPLVE